MVESSESRAVTGWMFECGAQMMRVENGSGNPVQFRRSDAWTDGSQDRVSRGKDRVEHLPLAAFNFSEMVGARDIRPVPVRIGLTPDNDQVSLPDDPGA